MSIMNMFLQSLLEAPGDNARTNTQNRSNRRRNQNDDTDNPDNQTDDTDTTETNEEGEDNQDGDDTEGTEEETGEDNDTEQGNEDETENEDEQNNEEETGDDETEGEDNEGEGDEDDFSMNPDEEEGEDNEPPPDGLTDPDDDGSNDDASSEDEGETNIHTNVLNLSKLDRLLAKRKCLSDFYDLRTSVDTFRSVIENNEAVIDPDVRQAAVRDLNKLYTSIGEYLMYRFGYTNYEENLQNYFIFIRSMNDIVKVVGEKGMKNPNKT